MKNGLTIQDANTIGQYHALVYIRENFMPGSLELEFLDRNTVKGTDVRGQSLLFQWSDLSKSVSVFDPETHIEFIPQVPGLEP